MSSTAVIAARVAVAFLIVFVSGYRLSRAGKPYGTALLTIHKLIALGVLVFVGFTVYGANTEAALGTVAWLAVGLAVVAFVATIATGGVLSALESSPATVKVLHAVLPFVTVVATATALLLLPLQG